MKTSLSVLIAASAAIALVPLTFAENASSTSNTVTAAESSSSSLSSKGPCDDKLNLDKVLCMNEEARKSKTVTLPKTKSNKVLSIISSCTSTKGASTLACLRKLNKAVVKTVIQIEQKVMSVDNTIGKKVQGTIRKPKVPTECIGKRGSELATCIQGLSKTNTSSSSSAAN